jgi:hypothetical protein
MSAYVRDSVFKLIRNALALFADGRMFRDYRYLSQRLGIGVAVTALVVVAVSFLVRSPIVLALVGGLVGGALMPYLFGDVRYQ